MESRASARDGPARLNFLIQMLSSMPLVFPTLFFLHVKQRLYRKKSVCNSRPIDNDVCYSNATPREKGSEHISEGHFYEYPDFVSASPAWPHLRCGRAARPEASIVPIISSQ